MNAIQRAFSFFFGSSNQATERRNMYTEDITNGALFLNLGTESSAGIKVTAESSLRVAIVFACVRVLSESLASIPVSLYKKRTDGGSDMADNRPEHDLVHNAPSELYTAFSFFQTMQAWVSLRGNAYAKIVRDIYGDAVELQILHPDTVTPMLYNGQLYYDLSGVDMHGRAVSGQVKNMDMLHFKGLSMDGILGKSPIAMLRDSIGVGLAQNEYAGGTLKNRAQIPGFMSTDQQINKAQLSEVRDSWRSEYSGSKNSGKTPFLQGGWKFVPMTMTAKDAEFIATAKITETQICGAFRVPPHKVAILDKATFSNIEHQGLEFYMDTMRPIVKAYEQELNRKLIPVSRQSRYFFRFNMDAILRADLRTRMQAHVQAIQWGIMNRDEVRAIEGLNPIENDLGKLYITPMNMQVLGEEPDQDDSNGETTTEETSGTPAQSKQ